MRFLRSSSGGPLAIVRVFENPIESASSVNLKMSNFLYFWLELNEPGWQQMAMSIIFENVTS